MIVLAAELPVALQPAYQDCVPFGSRETLMFVALPLIMLFVLAGISVRMIPRRLATAIIERQRRLRGLWARRMPFVSSKRFLLNFAPVRDF